MNQHIKQRIFDGRQMHILAPSKALMVILLFVASATLVACTSGAEEQADSAPVESSQPVEEEKYAGPAYEAEDLLTFESSGQIGYRLADGTVIIEPQYDMGFDFNEYGVAAVYYAEERAWVYIDKTGQVLVRTAMIDNGPDYFEEGLARYEEGDKMGFINEKAEIVIEAQFDWAASFRDGEAKVCVGCESEPVGEYSRMVGGDWWTIDHQGNKIADIDPPE